MQARGFTVGPLAENCWVAGVGDRAVVVDPGDEAERLIDEIGGLTVEAILLTHTHFDHVGAVAALARHTGAPVHCPRIEIPVLADINSYVFPGYGPYEPYEADHALDGGEHLTLAGLEIDVLLTPGHSPGHVSFSVPEHRLLLSGDVLFQGSIGRTDLPGGDTDTLMASIRTLLDALPDDTRVLPGHMGVTTLGQERATNPFLHELSAR